jgi:hypothetical protein
LWSGQFETMTPDRAKKLSDMTTALAQQTGVYRRGFRAQKR